MDSLETATDNRNNDDSSHMNLVRRCKTLFLEPASQYKLNLKNLVDAEKGLVRTLKWLAYAAHLSRPVEIDQEQFQILTDINEIQTFERKTLCSRYSSHSVDSLIETQLIVSAYAADGTDNLHRELAWFPLARLYHMHGRWSNVNLIGTEFEQSSKRTQHTLPHQRTPPAYLHVPKNVIDTVALEEPDRTWLDALLSRRSTCRDFDHTAFISLQDLARIVGRVWRVQSRETLDNGLEIVTKNSPGGGSIHSIETYLIVRRVNQIRPGIYHYNPLDHRLELMKEMPQEDLDALIDDAVAGQDYFATVPVLCIMTSRFDRLFWKYRNHSKAFKVCNMDAGHLSQNLYLTAAEMDLGVFVSAAVNDMALEQALDINPNQEGVIAVCGFGPRQKTT